MSRSTFGRRGHAPRPLPFSRTARWKYLPTLFACALLAASAGTAFARDFKFGSIEIERPWSRATPPGAAVGGGYLTIRNAGDAADRLVAADAAVADHVEIHEMAVKNGIMTMRALPDGLEIPPRADVSLDPSHYHLMLIGLRKPLRQGQSFKGTLTFAKAGKVDVEFVVESIAAAGSKSGGQSMPGMDMGN